MTLTVTSCSRSLRRVAVTTISSRPELDAVSASALAAMDTAGPTRSSAAANGHPNRLLEGIAHPFNCCLFPTLDPRHFFGLLAVRCANIVLVQSLILMLTSIQEN